MSAGNDLGRVDHDTGASGEAQANFDAVAGLLESLIAARDGDVSRAMSDYVADGVSEVYHAKEVRWHQVAHQVRHIVGVLRASMEEADGIAFHAQSQARGHAESI